MILLFLKHAIPCVRFAVHMYVIFSLHGHPLVRLELSLNALISLLVSLNFIVHLRLFTKFRASGSPHSDP